MSARVTAMVRDLEERGDASRESLALLLSATGEEMAALLAAGDRARAAAAGDEVHLRALIEFSNHCRRNCRYCGLRRDHRALRRYRMSPEEIVDASRSAAAVGFGTVVLQSGEEPHYSADLLADTVRAIRMECDAAITLSIGERPEADYRVLREAGADRFLLRMETSSPALYRRLHPDSDWRQRLACLDSLWRLGYQVGSGVMIGLPGQSAEMLAEDLLFLRSLDLDMIGVGPFIPHPATPLAGSASGALDLSLRFIACLRLLCPEALIPATTALDALHPRGRLLALRVGADVLMPDVTPARYQEHYQLYPGRPGASGGPAESRAWAEAAVVSLGRRVALGYGHTRRGRVASHA